MLRHAALRRGWSAAATRWAGRQPGGCAWQPCIVRAPPGGQQVGVRRRSVPATAASANPSPSSSPTPSPWRLYDHPPLYDALFAFRDFGAEVAFVSEALAKHGSPPGSALSTFLDAGCGPAHHARRAAASGVATSLALDASPSMLAYAAAEAEREGVTIRTAAADLTNPASVSSLSLPPADAALAALGTLAHAVAPGAPAAAFASFAAALRPGGVLVLELAAAEDVFDGTLISGDAWDVRVERGVVEAAAGPEAGPAPSDVRVPSPPRPGGFGKGKAAPEAAGGGEGEEKEIISRTTARLVVEYGTPDDAWDASAQVLIRTVTITEALPKGAKGRKGGGRGAPPSRLIGSEAVPQRVFTPQEIALLGAAAGLDLVAQYGDMGFTVRAGGGGGDRWVGVLKKREA